MLERRGLDEYQYELVIADRLDANTGAPARMVVLLLHAAVSKPKVTAVAPQGTMRQKRITVPSLCNTTST